MFFNLIVGLWSPSQKRKRDPSTIGAYSSLQTTALDHANCFTSWLSCQLQRDKPVSTTQTTP